MHLAPLPPVLRANGLSPLASVGPEAALPKQQRTTSPQAGALVSNLQRVVTLVVLADLDEAWQPDEYVFRIGDFETRLRFPVCKLIEKLDGDWREDQSLPVQIARAQVEALRTAGDPEGRYRAKWRLVRKGQVIRVLASGCLLAENIDLRVFRPDGWRIADDTKFDKAAAVDFTTTVSGDYRLSMELARTSKSAFCLMVVMEQGGHQVATDDLSQLFVRYLVGNALIARNESQKGRSLTYARATST